MSDKFAKAHIIPLPDDFNGDQSTHQPRELDPNKIKDKIEFDFNPESLSINVQNGQEKDPGRKGRQESQFVGSTKVTLSFQAIFDNTRPKTDQVAPDSKHTRSNRPHLDTQNLDVRIKTAKIANLIQEFKRKGQKPSPRRVRFCWGSTIFDGMIKSFSETLDYFSAEGVPLRSKVNISITEQRLLYEIDANSTESEDGTVDNSNNLSVGRQNNFNLNANLGLNVNLAVGAKAGVALSNEQALGVFGGAVIANQFSAGLDLGLISGVTEFASVLNDNRPATSWAPDGPKGGSFESELAALVNQNRVTAIKTGATRINESSIDSTVSVNGGFASGQDINPTLSIANNRAISSVPSEAKLLPVRGSPPLSQGFSGVIANTVFKQANQINEVAGEQRPSWESLDSQPVSGLATTQKNCCRKASDRKW